MGSETAARVLRHEAEALLALSRRLGNPFEQALRLLADCKGKVVTVGLGKSGLIARKSAATFASTGTVSVFLHAVEALHGDVGTLSEQDLALLYSHSGESDEILRLFPIFKALEVPTILLTGRPNSSCARQAQVVLDTGVQEEACSLNLAPTTSTTAMLGLSDALAIALMELKGFGENDYAFNHPLGALGRRLHLTVREVMRSGDDFAVVPLDNPVLEVLRSISKAGVGGACVVDQKGDLAGFISDGDIRRHFLAQEKPFLFTAEQIMVREVTTIEPETRATDALHRFQSHPKKIGEMPVNENEKPIGLLMLKDLVRIGLS